jgi:hypothetical protein
VGYAFMRDPFFVLSFIVTFIVTFIAVIVNYSKRAISSLATTTGMARAKNA